MSEESSLTTEELARLRDRLDVIDGDIVDLNRISLPADTPIIDKRFESGNKR